MTAAIPSADDPMGTVSPLMIAREALESARAGDWEAVARLDRDCRERVQRFAVSATPDGVSSLRSELAEVLGLYEGITRLASEGRAAVATELLRSMSSRRGAQAYAEAHGGS